ncbi:MAG: hypothetical protein K0R26_1304 [Bacteroidota bacterium]|jgi:hypothetical protein|nr:hypothetical protein [Bacteroidota bacterium]
MPENSTFPVEYPPIKSAGVYYFNTSSGLRYEVRFGRRQDNILHSTIVFGVINEEFEGEEYVTTNRGEVYRVMNTIVKIVKDFMEHHSKVNIYEFHAIDRDDEEAHSPEELKKNKIKVNARLKLYKRYLPKIFEHGWNFNFEGNNAIVTKI